MSCARACWGGAGTRIAGCKHVAYLHSAHGCVRVRAFDCQAEEPHATVFAAHIQSGTTRFRERLSSFRRGHRVCCAAAPYGMQAGRRLDGAARTDAFAGIAGSSYQRVLAEVVA
jgi:hypothetical protein